MRREYLEDRLRRPSTAEAWPTWDDLSGNAVIVEPALVEGIADRLRKFRLCVVAGPEGRGKTSLARLFGYRQLARGRTVFHIDLSEPGDETLSQFCAAIEQMD